MAFFHEALKEKVLNLPDKPGIYQYFDDSSKIIYIGKAKSLKKRVSSYFNKQQHENAKTALLVRKIVDVNIIIVDSEKEALILESSLIKKHQPKYNIQLKDDKTFPWICIKNERFPRVFATRQLVKDGSEYFGPYTSAKLMHSVLDLITKNYQLRNCNFVLSPDNVEKKKHKVCLEFHLGNCLGPCEGLQKEEDYNSAISEIRKLVKGNRTELITELKNNMQKLSGELKFEAAHEIKEKLDFIEKFHAKSVVVNPSIEDVDVFSLVQDESLYCVNYMKIIDGAIVQGHSIEITSKLDETKEDVLSFAILDLRARFHSKTKEVIVPFEMDFPLDDLTFIVPQRGDKKKLLDLSERNAKFFLMDIKKQKESASPMKSSERILAQLKKDLRLSETPFHIECFDNSNLQGTNAVAACVVFKNAKPAKKDYRHFNIKTVVGPDDFASMEEVVYRRYKRMLEDGASLPQLIIIDGGKGQLSSAVKSLSSLGLYGKIAVIGIAKKLEEIYFPEDSLPIYIDKKSESLKLIQQLRNEAHRFGITHHRSKRARSLVKSVLDEIPGFGEASKKKLLDYFGSVERIKKAQIEQLESVLGQSKAKIVFDFFTSQASVKS